MLNFRKIICLVLALVLMLAFIVSCDKSDEVQSSSSVPVPSSSSSSSSSTEESSEPEEVVTSIREGEGLNSEMPDYTTPVPPNYQPQSKK